jgi:hypothetical protein
MNEQPIDLNQYENVSYLDLLEIASSEQDIEKREALFEYSNLVLETKFMKAVQENDEKGFTT